MKKLIIIKILVLVGFVCQAQISIIYRGDFADGFSVDSVSSFTPNYTALANYQFMYTGDDEDGFAKNELSNFTPNYTALANYQFMYTGDDEDGFSQDDLYNFTPNYANLLNYQFMYKGHFADGFAMDSTSYTTPLPVTLLSFDGQALGKKNYLFWKTATEENVSHFALGKGKDGSDFTSIAQVVAKGNSSVENKYDYNDYHDIAGSNYYRLKIIDYDDQFSYSKVIKLTNKENNFSILLAPNPASDYLSIKFSTALKSKQSSVKLINVSGQVLMTDNMKENTVQHNLNLAHLSTGSYYIVLSIDNETFSLPFVKR